MKNQILCLIALTAPLSAAELVASQVPASAKWTLHLDMDAMRESETGKAIFARIEADHGAKLQGLKRISSVHLINDLNDITLLGDGKPEHAVALIHGTFDQGHMVDVVKASDDYSEENYNGFTIRSWKDKEQTQHAAFASDGLLVFSRQDDSLKQELDVLKTNAPATADPIFSSSGGKPLIAATANLGETELPPDASKILRLASVLRIAATENNGRFSIHMGAESKDNRHANRLRRVLDGILALAEAGNATLGNVDFQSEVTATQNQPGVNVALSVPIPAWLQIMKEAADRKKDAAH
ncbi:MAG: hypothetical protein ABIS50_26455 [Luteolibacter sp.]|uniref:hypothetical protein n=1 Tax=Luteolibacter sp. TaxID=1962973 RepID=UPI0032676C77